MFIYKILRKVVQERHKNVVDCSRWKSSSLICEYVLEVDYQHFVFFANLFNDKIHHVGMRQF